MEYFFPTQLGVLLYTLAVGVAAAVLYDAILIKRSVFGVSAPGMFVGDLFFCLFTYALLTLCVLKANYGMMRWYELLCPFASVCPLQNKYFTVYGKSRDGTLQSDARGCGFCAKTVRDEARELRLPQNRSAMPQSCGKITCETDAPFLGTLESGNNKGCLSGLRN